MDMYSICEVAVLYISYWTFLPESVRNTTYRPMYIHTNSASSNVNSNRTIVLWFVGETPLWGQRT